MTDEIEWQPPKDAVVKIVCAAHRYNDLIIPSPRHGDKVSRTLIKKLLGDKGFHSVEQGFIDQWGRFYNREEAWLIVQANGQPFNQERNGPTGRLFSEGIY